MSIFNMIDQPVLLLDETVTRKNIDRMVIKANAKKVSFRPHFKTHQSAQIGEWFKQKGVNRITVSSVEMAEYFADNGWDDISIAFSLNPRQMKRINDLAQRIHLEVLIENTEALQTVNLQTTGTLGVWIKIDVGNHRTGLDWLDVPEVLSLCQKVKKNGALRLLGLLTHSGNTYQAASKKEVCSVFREGVNRLEQLRLDLEEKGVKDLRLSVGDTPGCTLCEDWSSIDEIRPGNFVFYDAMQANAGICNFDDVSVALACPVVAKHENRREIVVYGGAIHLSKDFIMLDGKKSFGIPSLESGNRWSSPIPGGIVRGLSQEHGIIHIPGEEFEQIQVGDLLFIIPAHSCLTVQVMGRYLTLDGKWIRTFNRQYIST